MFIKSGDEMRKLYKEAKKGSYAFVASNVAETNIMIGLMEGAEKSGSDLVLQLSRSACEFAGNGDALAGLKAMGSYMEEIAEKYDIGVFLNMDHLKDLDFIQKAIQTGFPSSVMIDASEESFEDNVEKSRQAKEMAEGKDVLIEAELGRIKGVENDVSSDESYYTDPEKAVDFVRKTKCDLLAISVGTKHGVSKGKDLNLRTGIAKEVNEKLIAKNKEVPLVIHGSSGLTHDQMKELAEKGVCKFNKDTRYQYEYARTAAKFYIQNKESILPPGKSSESGGPFTKGGWSPNKDHFDPRVVSRKVRKGISEVIEELNGVVGSQGKSLYI
ncbi:MAG: class II fructose-bisphosphate aldolase [Candidatus Aenigmatarchaeota archaeon]